MNSSFPRGFKTRAADLAVRTRSDMGLGVHVRLDPRALAAHMRIPVFEIPDLRDHGLSEASICHLLGAGVSEFSAGLFQRDGVRIIVANPKQSTARQASNITHELSHVLLEHEPVEEIVVLGCRRWNRAMEDQADWLAGEILVPRDAALRIVREGAGLAEAAAEFGVSIPMMTWRLNHSGARKQVERERQARARRWRG